MKYVIRRLFSFNNEKYEVIRNSQLFSNIKVIPSKQHKNQFNIQLSNMVNERMEEDSCIVEPDEKRRKSYFIYSVNNETKRKVLFGQFYYELSGYDNYSYTIIIGQKLYKVRSSDLKDRRLAIIDTLESHTHQCQRLDCPHTLYQVIDLFSKSNEIYHVNIHDREWALGYLAITILLHVHESQRNDI